MRLLLLVSVLGLVLPGHAAVKADDEESSNSPHQADMTPEDVQFFADHIAPLLQEKCAGCHSHASQSMEGGLTLDSQSGWSNGGDRGPAVVPGRPEESLLLQAVAYKDPDLQMPPDERLTAQQIKLLTEWIRRGAPDPRTPPEVVAVDADWWSLRPLQPVAVPGDGHPVDAFIQARLQQQQLSPVPAADRRTLIRRAFITLHGLPPTPEQTAAFVNDGSVDAWPQLIDSLLASPRYGEHWARHWLDVIHFADSHGCEHDVKRPHAWRFRDYVISRFNDDMPYPRFVREQLAADVFYPQQPELTAALGFLAAGPLELSRAGTAPVTFDYLDRDDMVTQTMAAITSTTVNCARCHRHKFDPISQEDYYSLQAVFAGVGKGDLSFETSADVQQQRRELSQLRQAAAARNGDVLLQQKYASRVQSWLSAQAAAEVDWLTLRPDVFVSAGGATLTRQADHSILASGVVPDEETYTLTAPVPGERVTAIRIEALRDESLPMNGPGRAGNGNFHLSELRLQWFPAAGVTPQTLSVSRTSTDFDQDGWTSAQAVDGDRKSGWAIYPRVDQTHAIVLELQQPLDLTDGGRLALTLQHLYPPKHVMGRVRVAVTAADPAAARLLPSDVAAAVGKPQTARTQEEKLAIAAAALEEYAVSRQAELPPLATVYGVSSDWSHAKKLPQPMTPKKVHVLQRGAFDRPQQEVGPGALSAIDWLPARFSVTTADGESVRRAALADWLVHADNPLTHRSIVNRVWQFHFGQGLVNTPNDFGRMGGRPSHPELLDWLAVWFRDEASGSLKQLHRLLMTSDAWRRNSMAGGDPTGQRVDAGNRLLWRQNRSRLTAEMFRDSVLQISGRLDLTMGGPGVEQFRKSKGPQATPALDYDGWDWESPQARRRSIYRVVWRGIADPFMEALDFPDLGLLAPQRGFSVSSLQSLTLLNNDFVLHASQWMSDRICSEHSDVSDQVRRAISLAWLRSPTQAELARGAKFVQRHGLAAYCRVLFNSNEFLFVD
ncbi:MAG: PSD1 and planctomycete cytochrome C domain-containing protein [Planctomycetaceae bacterium]|nr:PSD1 and planctomycete cytochrome C domain-containing protein [Planctomycetaceae bacterium]